GVAVEPKRQVGVGEGPQRVVQEIVTIEAQLQSPAFAEVKVLEQSQVRVEEGRAVNDRQYGWSILADLAGNRETGLVDVLIRAQIRARIAGDQRAERNGVRAQQRRVAHIKRRAGNLVAVGVHAEVVAPV